MAVALELVEEPLIFTQAEIKSLNGYVLKMGDAALILSAVNYILIEKINEDWIEAIANALGLNLRGAIETAIKNGLRGSTARLALGLTTSLIGLIRKAVIALLRVVWNKVANELMIQALNATMHNAWAEANERVLPH